MKPFDASRSPSKQLLYTPPMKSILSTPKTQPSETRQSNYNSPDLYHVIHKVPSGDSPYVKAKHVQLIEKDPNKAVSLFWSAINAGDRIDSALKDMAVVMKQLDRSDEAIEAIKSFRHLCSPASQESLDNVLVELYKRSGRLSEQIQILEHRLKRVEEGNVFGGKRVKVARSQGKKVHITVEQEYARLLGNLGWAYLQQCDYRTAEEYYRKALSIEADRNRQCNLAVCLMYMDRITEAKFLLQVVRDSAPGGQIDESYAKSYERASHLLAIFESQPIQSSSESSYSCKTTYTPPARTKRLIPRCPYTQPRRVSVMSDNGNWNKELYGNDSINRSQRRLQFEKPENPEANLSSAPTLNEQVDATHIAETRTPSGAVSEVSGHEKKQDRDFPGCVGRKRWADIAEEEEEAENLDLNIMVSSHNPELSPIENLSRKLECSTLGEHRDEEQCLVQPKRGGRLKVFEDIIPSP